MPMPTLDRFELTSGHLCLDFANTVVRRRTPHPVEGLPDYAALIAWSKQAGLLTAAEARRLGRLARTEPAPATRCWRQARRLRDLCFEVFARRATGAAPTRAMLHSLNRWIARLQPSIRLEPRGRREVVRLDRNPGLSLDTPLWPVLSSAVEILTGPLADRVRLCAADDCDWLFLDRNRGHRRRWCDMKVCGNRAKARRHYRRTRRAAGQAHAPRRALADPGAPRRD